MSAMTKKEYELIARALAAARERTKKFGFTGLEALDAATLELSNVLAYDNPRFDHERFREAVNNPLPATSSARRVGEILRHLNPTEAAPPYGPSDHPARATL